MPYNGNLHARAPILSAKLSKKFLNRTGTRRDHLNRRTHAKVETTMKDEHNSEAQHAFSSKDLEGFLKRLGIPVNGETVSLAFAIDFAMRRGNRAEAEARAQELMDLFRASPLAPGDDDGRVEHNDNALDREQPVAKLISDALTLYENMQITLQAADPEESMGEIYSDETMNLIAGHAGLPNDPLIKPWLKRIGTVFATGGRDAAQREAGGLIGHLVADGHIEETDAARAEMLERIMDNVALAEASIENFGDPDGNEDFYGDYDDAEGSAQADVEIDLSLKIEEDRLAREADARAHQEYGRREGALFETLATRADGLIASLGLDLTNADDAALSERFIALMRQFAFVYGKVTPDGIAAATAAMQDIEAFAAEVAAQRAGRGGGEAITAETLTRQIVQEADEVTRQHEAQQAQLQVEARAAVEEQMRQEAEAAVAPGAAQGAPDQTRDNTDQDQPTDQPDPAPTEWAADDNPDPAKTTDLDVQKVAMALKENGEKEARQVAARIAGMAHDEGTLPVSEADMVEDLLASAQIFNAAADEYERKERAAVEKALKAQQDAKVAKTTPPAPETGETQAQPTADAPRLSDYRAELQHISFLLAEGSPTEARALAVELAATLRAFGGQFAKIDEAMILKHVMREDKKAKDKRASVATDQTDSDSDDATDRASWFLSMALRKDARSGQIYDGLVRAIMSGDKQASGKLAKALANHILQLYKTKVTIVEMLTAIVDAAKLDAKAKQDAQGKLDDISELSSDSGDSSDGNDPGGADGGDSDDDDDFSDRASWFLMTAVDKDAKSAEIYDALVRVLLKGDKSTGAKLAKALATHILKLYKTNVTMAEMLEAIINAARQDVKANRDDSSQTSSDSGYDGDNDDTDTEDDDQDGAADAVAADANTGASESQTKYDMGTIKRVDWQGMLSVYSMDPEEGEAAADVAKLIVKKGMESPGVLKSAKDLLTRSSKKVKGAKVKNHKHFVAAIEDAMIKKTESKKVVKPLKFADISDDMSDDISV